MKISVCQLKTITGDRESNYKKVLKWAEDVMKTSPDVLVLPELWETSYAYDILPELSKDGMKKNKQFCSELAKKYSVNVIGGSVADNRDGKVYNTALAYNREGDCIYVYDKVHRASSMYEELHFEGGEKMPKTFFLDGVKVGLLVCYDLRFPEISRPIAVDGAELIFYVAAWPLARVDHWTTLLKTRAIENEAFVVGCDRAGENDGFVLGGKCIIYDPYGKELASCGTSEEGTCTADINLSVAKEFRKLVNVFQDRCPKVYNSL